MVVTKGKRQGQGRDFQSCVTVLAWFVLPSEITNWCGLPSAMSFLDYVESSHRLHTGLSLDLVFLALELETSCAF